MSHPLIVFLISLFVDFLVSSWGSCKAIQANAQDLSLAIAFSKHDSLWRSMPKSLPRFPCLSLPVLRLRSFQWSLIFISVSIVLRGCFFCQNAIQSADFIFAASYPEPLRVFFQTCQDKFKVFFVRLVQNFASKYATWSALWALFYLGLYSELSTKSWKRKM